MPAPKFLEVFDKRTGATYCIAIDSITSVSQSDGCTHIAFKEADKVYVDQSLAEVMEALEGIGAQVVKL